MYQRMFQFAYLKYVFSLIYLRFKCLVQRQSWDDFYEPLGIYICVYIHRYGRVSLKRDECPGCPNQNCVDNQCAHRAKYTVYTYIQYTWSDMVVTQLAARRLSASTVCCPTVYIVYTYIHPPYNALIGRCSPYRVITRTALY